jgi:hypothetical protein
MVAFPFRTRINQLPMLGQQLTEAAFVSENEERNQAGAVDRREIHDV